MTSFCRVSDLYFTILVASDTKNYLLAICLYSNKRFVGPLWALFAVTGQYRAKVSHFVYLISMFFKGTMSAVAHAQYSPVETNLHTTRSRIFAFPPLQKLSKIPQQTASVITNERL